MLDLSCSSTCSSSMVVNHPLHIRTVLILLPALLFRERAIHRWHHRQLRVYNASEVVQECSKREGLDTTHLTLYSFSSLKDQQDAGSKREQRDKFDVHRPHQTTLPVTLRITWYLIHLRHYAVSRDCQNPFTYQDGEWFLCRCSYCHFSANWDGKRYQMDKKQ